MAQEEEEILDTTADVAVFQRPFFPSDPTKRIDYVLVCKNDIDTNIKTVTTTNGKQTFSKTREIFLENLKNVYNVEYEAVHSKKFTTPTTFYLLHMPFEEVEKHARRLRIHKRISEEFIGNIDDVFRNLTGRSDFSDIVSQAIEKRVAMTFRKRQSGSVASESVTNDEHWKSSTVEDEPCDLTHSCEEANIQTDYIDDWERMNDSMSKQGCVNRILYQFRVKHVQLQPKTSYYTAIYNRQIRVLFHGVYKKTGELNKDTMFTPAERSRILNYILRECFYIPMNPAPDSTCIDFGMEALLGDVAEVFTAAYPLHSGPIRPVKSHKAQSDKRSLLYHYWGRYRTMFQHQPLDHIRSYFGEKIALYFAWLQYYIKALVVASFWGILPIIHGLYYMNSSPLITDICKSGSVSKMPLCPECDGVDCRCKSLGQTCFGAKLTWLFDNDMTIVYTIIMAIWCALFLEFWKRTQFKLNFDWNLNPTEESENDFEPVRPKYRARAADAKMGTDVEDPITFEKQRYIPSSKKIKYKLVSYATVLSAIVVVIIAMLSFMIYRYAMVRLLTRNDKFQIWLQTRPGLLRKLSPHFIASVTSSIISSISILVLNRFYRRIAIKLNEMECHRTQAKFERALTMKLFWFQFTNYFSPLVYLAFFKNGFQGYPGNYKYVFGIRLLGCEGGNCTYPLAIQMITILVISQTKSNFKEILVPMLKQWWKRCKDVSGGDDDLSLWEDNYTLEPVEDMTLFYEYLEMVTQYGFVTLFVTAFPFSPLMALCNNILEVKIDAAKFLKFRRRAVSEVALRLGAWEDILKTISHLAVLTNAMTIAFTTNHLNRIQYRWELRKGLKGFVESSLSAYNTTCFTKPYKLTGLFNGNKEHISTCYFYGNRLPSSADPCRYETTKLHWKLWCIRFVFVFVLVRGIMFIQDLVDWLVPDRSKRLERLVKRQKHLTQILVKQSEMCTQLDNMSK